MSTSKPLKVSIELKWLEFKARVAIVFKQLDTALACFDSMLSLSPGHRHASASKGFLLAQLGRRDEAIRCLKDLTQIYPDDAGTWFNLGFLLDEAGQLQAAHDAFLRATELNGQLDRAFYGLALTSIRLGLTDLAIKALQQNTTLQPMSPHGWYQLAMVHFHRQELKETKKIIKHLAGFEPKVADQLKRETGLSPT